MSYGTLTELWHRECEGMLKASRADVTVASLTIVKFDRMVQADSMEYDIDISKELWLTAGRFTGLQRDYVDPAALKEFVAKASSVSTKRPQIAQMQCRMKGQRHVSYKWGNCILGFTFRRAPEPMFTMMSRTSMITRMGGLDLALAYCIADEIAAASDEAPWDYGFTWHLASLQHSSLQAVPYWHAHGWHEKTWSEEQIQGRPALRSMVRQLEYFDRLDREGREQVHGTRRRVREQRRAFVAGKLKREAAPLEVLNLDRLKGDW